MFCSIQYSYEDTLALAEELHGKSSYGIGIIGSADGPTKIYVSFTLSVTGVAALALLICVIILIKRRKK